MNAKTVIGVCIVLFIAIYAEDYFRAKWAHELVEKEKARITEEYKLKLELKENEIRILRDKLAVSTKQYEDLKGRIKKTEVEVENVKPPASRVELVNRFGVLGYPVVPCK